MQLLAFLSFFFSRADSSTSFRDLAFDSFSLLAAVLTASCCQEAANFPSSPLRSQAKDLNSFKSSGALMPLVALALQNRLCNASAPVNFFIVNLLGDLSSCTYSDHWQKCSACLRNIWHQRLIFDTSAAVGPRPSLISVSKSNASHFLFGS